MAKTINEFKALGSNKFRSGFKGCRDAYEENLKDEEENGFDDRYRTNHGGFNNKKYPLINYKATPLRAETPQAFSKNRGIRESVTGDPLPLARHLSNIFFKNGEIPTSCPMTTDLHVHFCQFVEHDIILSMVEDSCNCCPPVTAKSVQSGEDCESYEDPSCISIQIEQDDPIFHDRGVDCISMQRVMVGPDLNCHLDRENGINFNTGWLDMESVTENSDLSLLNTNPNKPILKVSRKTLEGGGERFFLPNCNEGEKGCPECKTENAKCCNSGDQRVSEQPHLTFLHTFFHRVFIYVAEQYKNSEEYMEIEASLTTNREKADAIFQWARRTTVAMYQNIIYKEFLPLIIGDKLMMERNLFPLEMGSGYSKAYDDNIDARSGINWNTAYRFGHTMVKHLMTLVDDEGMMETVNLADFFMEGCSFVRQNNAERRGNDGDNMNKLFRGASSTYGAKATNCASLTMKPKLFSEFTNAPENTNDMIAMDIQRGRDFGAATYNRARQFCQTKDFGSVGSFEELFDDNVISEENVRLLKSEYSSVDDIDLFVGGMLEKPLPDALVGPTFACIIADQFSRLKDGDRFYFEFDTYKYPLTLDQIDEIRQVTFSRLACLVLDGIQEVPQNAFLIDNEIPMVDCDSFPDLKLGLTPAPASPA